MTTVISVENLSKTYRLGQIGTGTFAHDLAVWWAKLRGQPDPRLKIGQADHANRDGEELWALKNVSFTVQQGEVLGIIGRNGAGKSTLLKILSRVTAPTSGIIKVKGRIASLLEVGTGFHPELTGRENVYLNGAILGMTKAEVTRKFDEIVDFAGVEKFIDTPVKRYSSGMYVRLAFAVAAHLDPEILVVDEVLAVGDAEFQKKCLGKMGDVARGGRTVLFVSHNMAAMQSLCNRALILEKGQLKFNGSTEDAISHYLQENPNLQGVPLKDRTDRGGNGHVRIEDAYFLDANQARVSTLMSGGAFSFAIEISNSFRATSNALVLVTIYDKAGYPLIHLNNEMTGEEIILPAGTSLVKCFVPSFLLRQGIYYLNIAVSHQRDTLDHLSKALWIEVVDSLGNIDYSKAYSPAPLATQHSWKVI